MAGNTLEEKTEEDEMRGFVCEPSQLLVTAHAGPKQSPSPRLPEHFASIYGSGVKLILDRDQNREEDFLNLFSSV